MKSLNPRKRSSRGYGYGHGHSPGGYRPQNTLTSPPVNRNGRLVEPAILSEPKTSVNDDIEVIAPPPPPKNRRRSNQLPVKSALSIIQSHIGPPAGSMASGVKRSLTDPQSLHLQKRLKTGTGTGTGTGTVPNGTPTEQLTLHVSKFQMGSHILKGDLIMKVSWPLTHDQPRLCIEISPVTNTKRYQMNEELIKKFFVCMPLNVLRLELKKKRAIPDRPDDETADVFYEIKPDDTQILQQLVAKIKKTNTLEHANEPSTKSIMKFASKTRAEREKEAAAANRDDGTIIPRATTATATTKFYGDNNNNNNNRLHSIGLSSGFPGEALAQFNNSRYQRRLSSSSSNSKLKKPVLIDSDGEEEQEEEKNENEKKQSAATAVFEDLTETAASTRPRRQASKAAEARAEREKQQKKEEEDRNMQMIANRETSTKIFGKNNRYTHLFEYDNKTIDITLDDFNRLNDWEYLNDNLINFFLKDSIDKFYKQDTTEKKSIAKNVYLFNTYFYAKLAQGKAGYDSVKRWTSKVDIFSHKYIVVPIHAKMHWYLAVIYNLPKLLDQQQKRNEREKQEKEQQEDSNDDEIIDIDESDPVTMVRCAQAVESSIDNGGSKRRTRNSGGVVGSLFSRSPSSKVASKPSRTPVENPEESVCIFVLDSLRSGTGHSNTTRILKEYICSEAREKKGVEIDRDLIYGFNPSCPQQTNYCDCGVYIVHYVETFLKNPERFAYLAIQGRNSKKDENIKQRIATMWNETSLVNKREQLRKYILQLKYPDQDFTYDLEKLHINGTSNESQTANETTNTNNDVEEEEEQEEEEEEEEEIMVVESKTVPQQKKYRVLDGAKSNQR